MSEFILIVAIVAVGTSVGISIFGDTVRDVWGQSSSALAGDEAPSSALPQYPYGSQGISRRLSYYGKDRPSSPTLNTPVGRQIIARSIAATRE